MMMLMPTVHVSATAGTLQKTKHHEWQDDILLHFECLSIPVLGGVRPVIGVQVAQPKVSSSHAMPYL